MFFFSLKSGNETCTMHPWFVYHPLAPARVKKCLKSLSSWPCFFDLSSFSIQTFRFLTFSSCLRGKPLMSCIKLLLFDVAIFGKFSYVLTVRWHPVRLKSRAKILLHPSPWHTKVQNALIAPFLHCNEWLKIAQAAEIEAIIELLSCISISMSNVKNP